METERKKQWLICVDSDGCAIDTMTIKHKRCFGPCVIRIWQLEEFEKPILELWNHLNLYSMNRGINRFCGLQRILTEIDNRYKKIEGIDVYSEWCSHTKIFSEAALEETIEVYKNSNAGLFYQSQGIFEKVLDWSRMVNREIEGLEEKEKTAFDGVKEALSEASKFADIAVVSSANSKAVEEEWHRCGLMDYVDYFMTQEMGTKEECVKKLLSMKYKKEHVLLLGDAPGDYVAAQKAGVLFYIFYRKLLAGFITGDGLVFCAVVHKGGLYAAHK